MGDIIGTGFDFPFRFEGGRVKTSRPLKDITPEDNAHAIRISIQQILGTIKGERVMVRDFGTYFMTYLFEPQGTTFEAIRHETLESLMEWEKRIAPKSFFVDETEPGKILVKLEYEILPLGEKDLMVWPIWARK